MQEDQPAIFAVVDPLCSRYANTLTGQFVSGSKIALSAFRPITSNTRDAPTESAGKDDVLIHMLQPEFVFDDPILRSLVAEANSTFVALQELKKRGSKAEYMKISRTYRSIIRACLEKLQDAIASAEEAEDADAQAKYQQYISIFYSIECVWHLSEILFLDPTPSNAVVPQLLDWIRFHFPASERMATDLLLLGREASDNDDYWPALKGLILQGQVDVARALLHLHPQAETPHFKLTDQILKTMPTYSMHGATSIQKFRSLWQYWLTDTERKISANILAIEPNLEELIQLVTGDTQMWNTQIQETEYWYEFFPGYLFYTNNACKHFELGNAANTWLSRWARLKGHNSNELQMKQLDRVILSLMENDMHQVIHAIQLMADNQWFVTHLTDLLYNAGQLQIAGENQVNECIKLRDSLLYDFGSSLMTRNSLWQLGMDYLDHCGQEGQAALALLLTKIPFRTEKQALKIICIAQKKGFFEAEQDICKIQSKKSLDEQRYGNALEWAIRSKDTLYVTTIADFLLNHYSKTGDMLCPDVIANIGAKMFISPRLVFLVKYFDFYQFYRKRDFLPAAELLVNLLESKITPEYFWPSLLIDSIPLLESKDPKILSKETCAILQHLETELVPLIDKKKKRLEKYPDEPINILKDYRIENIEEIINLLRLACARNLSRAIIIENTVMG
ncbi:nuclear pore complex protein Nup75 [Bactrocera dorsalis]|uniref:Nuclear pore complex protein Nup85 n=1 Tax=Bactrocera dorsalis TaxID=27457 RepID=A0A6I9UYZ8_BACDO|nr:nuclear pore complex protein Nup75 [Bactrocera dorsalis]